jgi:hypothetical protein
MDITMLADYPHFTATVCHDAGAGNIVIANLLETGRKDWHAYMQGPSEKLWKATFPEIALCDTLDSTLEGAELLITGTGWASDIEHEARKLARSRGIRSVAVIDHWANYAERFVRHDETVWPDEFWVTDDYAMDIAKETFPNENVFQIPNQYVEIQLRDIAKVEEMDTPELLYVLEPARSNWGGSNSGEFQALDYFVSHMSQLGLPPETRIRLRPHPSEEQEKYNDWITRHPSLNVQIDGSLNIAQSIGRSTWVVGCESFALVLALMSGRKVYCTLPPWAPACRLPHQGLIHISGQDQDR